MTFGLIVVISGVALIAVVLVFAATDPSPPSGLSDAHILAAAREGKRIVALRWYRTLHGVGLRRAVEGLAALEKREAPLLDNKN